MTSPLGNLRTRRAELAAAQIKHYQIPRWQAPELFLRFVPLPHEDIERGLNKVRTAKPNKRASMAFDANTDMLVLGCTGVYIKLDDTYYENTGPDTWEPITSAEDDATVLEALNKWQPQGVFTEDLAETLGLSGGTARMVLQSLFLADGDLVGAAVELGKFSGWSNEEADEDFLGV